MKEKSLKEKLMELKKHYIEFYNNGTIRKEDARYVNSSNPQLFITDNYGIDEVFESAMFHYVKVMDYPFDAAKMTLEAGIIYDEKDVNEDNTLKEGAKPLNKVHYYTGHVFTYENGIQTNKDDYYSFGSGRQTFVDYDRFVKEQINRGFIFNGPKTFEELKESILSNKNVEISLYLDLQPEKKLTLK